jgi:hypothetical protein
VIVVGLYDPASQMAAEEFALMQFYQAFNIFDKYDDEQGASLNLNVQTKWEKYGASVYHLFGLCELKI